MVFYMYTCFTNLKPLYYMYIFFVKFTYNESITPDFYHTLFCMIFASDLPVVTPCR